MMNSKTYNFLSFSAIILVFGFELRTFLVSFMPISVLTSIICALLFIVYFILFSKSKVKILKFDFLVGFFLTLYGIRLIYEIFYTNQSQVLFANEITFLVYYVFLMIVPYLLGRIIKFERLKTNKILKILLFLYSICLVLSLGNVFGNLDSNATGRYGANEALDTIAYGHLALSYCILAYGFFNNENSKLRNIWILLVAFGIISMVLANSRSPFVAFFLLVLIIFYLNFNIKLFFGAAIIILLLTTQIDRINEYLVYTLQSNFFDRFSSIFDFENDNSNGRDELFSQGFNIFLDNPLFGNNLLIRNSDFNGIYVHNLFIEVLMSLGLIGFIPFFLIILRVIKKGIFILKKNTEFTCLVLFPIFDLFILFKILIYFSNILVFNWFNIFIQ